mmetsp:Transcript_9519/g.23706  ORF Transcript_9519/g.23706 Transcript_9519/m.23706 type:complete len:111 (-) Transcript_9519:2595-2927(-)
MRYFGFQPDPCFAFLPSSCKIQESLSLSKETLAKENPLAKIFPKARSIYCCQNMKRMNQRQRALNETKPIVLDLFRQEFIWSVLSQRKRNAASWESPLCLPPAVQSACPA